MVAETESAALLIGGNARQNVTVVTNGTKWPSESVDCIQTNVT